MNKRISNFKLIFFYKSTVCLATLQQALCKSYTIENNGRTIVTILSLDQYCSNQTQSLGQHKILPFTTFNEYISNINFFISENVCCVCFGLSFCNQIMVIIIDVIVD